MWRDPWGRRVVGLLEGDIQDVPEEQLEALGLQGLEDAALEKALNSLPRQARPPLPFYPYGEEATQEILREIGALMEAEPADLGAHPLVGLTALGWKVLQEVRACPT